MLYDNDIANKARKAVAFEPRRRRDEVEALLKSWAVACVLSEFGGDSRRQGYRQLASERKDKVVAVITERCAWK